MITLGTTTPGTTTPGTITLDTVMVTNRMLTGKATLMNTKTLYQATPMSMIIK